MKNSGKSIIITGGAGYIGSHACLALVEAGFSVVVVDNLSNGHAESIQRVEALTGKAIRFYNVDVRDEAALARVFAQESPLRGVIHFAAFKAVGESVADPLRYYENNLGSTLTLLKVMQQHHVQALVFSSSAAVYGVSERNPVDESVPAHPINPYGRSKRMTEEILADLCQADPALRVTCLRYFNPVGAHKSGEIGEDPLGSPNNLLPCILEVASGQIPHLNVFGRDYATPDGTGIRDYIHVVDVASAHLHAMESLVLPPDAKPHGFNILNIGTGCGYSVLEVVHAFETVSGRKIPLRFRPRRPGDAAACFAEISRAKQELRWQATMNLHDMCADAWRWKSRYPNGY